MPLSLHQQAHYSLSEVTAVIEAILLTLLSLFSPLFLSVPSFIVPIGANYKVSAPQAPRLVAGDRLSQLSGQKRQELSHIPSQRSGNKMLCIKMQNMTHFQQVCCFQGPTAAAFW